MKKSSFMIYMFLVFMICVVGCNQQRQEARQEVGRGGTALYQDESSRTEYGYKGRPPETTRNETIRNSGQNEIGYYHVNPVNYDHNSTAEVYMDRSLLAKHIAQLVTRLPHVKTATTLVTDDHVFIGLQYRSPQVSASGKKKAVYEARRVAQSVTPRYFKVHVTDRQKLEQQINRVGMRMQRNGDIEGIHGDLNQLLRQMGDSTPPG
ncbi:Sporulation lipoprotein YhcN/YlaJ (Spore_YhcN_YlaJ) [Seinonella peptonophila]|uniref:Sporulation lipoprotein YhcN/YlaJ (Spore_YhcN_YlaJ) n=1 Tax=Seinonella peptonophila TaxID=112248 RepID=A0A1M4W8U5_9BACL|nr:YhcN/YlaJ family sporulation lipoprotein [Seinonella peptonophila]SHE77688.1 Sporulation lipoprotein YhcN/YlaJ (Spore_YhcN_YlaJ) [Seinonella peptonophila]